MTPEKVIDTPVGSDDVKESINDCNKDVIGDSILDETKGEVGVVSDNLEQEQTTGNTKEIKQQEDVAEVPNNVDAEVEGKDYIDDELESSKVQLDTLKISEDPHATVDERNTLEDSIEPEARR